MRALLLGVCLTVALPNVANAGGACLDDSKITFSGYFAAGLHSASEVYSSGDPERFVALHPLSCDSGCNGAGYFSSQAATVVHCDANTCRVWFYAGWKAPSGRPLPIAGTIRRQDASCPGSSH